MKRLVGRITSVGLVLALLHGQVALAQKGPYDSEAGRRRAGIIFVGSDGICEVSTEADFAPSAGQNADYAGRPIFTDGQLEQINLNKSVYERAAREYDIPWQMIAVIHLKETNLQRTNPGNGQGVYQFFDKRGGPYPTGPVDEAEFLRQSTLAAQFIKQKVNSNLSTNRTLTASNASPNATKDTFFSYNGRSSKYAQQGAQFGFDPDTQPFEGSPYVVNKVDRNRDPEFNTTTWGQVKVDRGPIEYPANRDYGAFVTYGVLAGVSTSSSGAEACAGGVTGDLAQKVVELARQELQGGANEADDSHTKYGGSPGVAWCGYFVSWIFEQAGQPFEGGALPAVSGILAYAQAKNIFHPAGEAGFVPQAGDVAIYKEGVGPYESHVNIVVGYDGGSNSYTAIGGNEGDGVRMREHRMNSISLTGFMRVQ